MCLTLFALIYQQFRIIKMKRERFEKSNFIDFLVHELKTPITTIDVSCDILHADNSLDNKSKLKKYNQIIKSENNRIKEIVEFLLHLSKLENNIEMLKFEILDLHTIVYQAVDSLLIQLENKKGEIELHLDAKVSQVLGNEFYLKNAIINVIENAIKYSSNPKIVIKTETKKNKIILKILDNGIGINTKDLSKIFNKFYQIGNNNNHDLKGFGLGLYFVKTVVEAHLGKISVSSKPKVGTEVNFYLLLHYKMY